MLPSRRHRAGALDVGTLPTDRAFALATAAGVFWQRLGVETCRRTRPAPSGAPPSHGWLRGHV
eukprot:3495310-Prymnesium_polylepis.1